MKSYDNLISEATEKFWAQFCQGDQVFYQTDDGQWFSGQVYQVTPQWGQIYVHDENRGVDVVVQSPRSVAFVSRNEGQ